MRLDKYLASVTDYSRSDAKKMIKSRRVSVADIIVVDPRSEIDDDAVVTIDELVLRSAVPRYFMLHKPQGYISATKDRTHLTALELLDEDNIERLHIAGRLDIDTTGLLLITDDGNWSHRVTSPNRDCKKTYWLEATDPITAAQIEQIEQGIKLDNEKRPTLPAAMELIDEHTARLTISEGKYHQVKRMLAAVGNHIDLLHRERIADITLDEDLAQGEYRALTPAEVACI
ncbi:MAG: 16S rRNA pseudouridine516 synthase [Oceanicoccus sp.]|jgi:16S rRNA pseudouridine516 synthase